MKRTAYDSQDEVMRATEGVAIARIRTDTSYTIAWELADGRLVGMDVSTGGGCSTCGYGAGEQSWYIEEPA